MRHIPLLLLIAIFFACPSHGATFEDLVKKNGIYYEIASDKPFSGEIRGAAAGFFKDGLKNGRWVYHHLNGRIKSSGDYQGGQKQGAWIGYYENGQVFYEGAYLSGVKDGPWVSFYDDGKLFYRGQYKGGKEDGRWEGYNPDGSVWAYRTGQFRDGFKISE